MQQQARQHFVLALTLVLFAIAAAGGARAQTEELSFLDSAQWTFNKNCLARGDTLIAALTYGLQAWDLVNPADPVLIGDYYAQARKAVALDWRGTLMVLVTQDGRLQVMDATDLTAIEHRADLAGFGTNADVLLLEHALGDFAFVAGSAGLKAVDLSDPDDPLLRDSLPVDGSPRNLAARGDTLYVLAAGSGLHTVDAGDPDDLILLDSDPLASDYLLRLDRDGPRLAVAARDDGFYTFDLSNPADPVFAAQVLPDLGGGALRVKDVAVADTLLLCATDGEGLLIYGIGDPSAPIFLGSDPDSWLVFEGITTDGGRAYLDYWDGSRAGVQIFDISDPVNPNWLGRTAGHDYCRAVDAAGDCVYSATGHQGVFAHEIAGEPGSEQLVLRGQLPVTNTWALHAAGDTVYIASAARGLVISDWSDPDNPLELGDLNLGICRAVQLVGTIAFVGVFGEGLATVDVSSPGNPVLLDQEGTGLETIGLAVQGALAATADRDDGLNLWDVSDPSDIIFLGNYPTSSRANDVELAGDIAYVSAGSDGVHVVDVGTPSSPLWLSSFSTAALAGDLLGERLYVARNGVGASVYDLSDPVYPLELDNYDSADNAQGIACLGDRLFVADYSALLALRLGNGTAAPASSPAETGLRLAACPNPFNPRTDLSFHLSDQGSGRLEIFDVGGRRLALLDEGPFAAGEHRIVWDGRDSRGRFLPSGVYFARLSVIRSGGGREIASHKLVLLR